MIQMSKQRDKERIDLYHADLYQRKVDSKKKKVKSRNRDWKQKHKHATIDTLIDDQYEE